MLKTLIIFLSLTTFQNLAIGAGGEGGGGTAGGNGGGGGSGGSKLAKRSVASIDPIEQSEADIVDSFASDCLKTLSSIYKLNSKEKDYRAKLDNEIIEKISLKRKDRSIANVNTIYYPECYAYAKETKNEIIKSLLGKGQSIPKNDMEEISPSSTMPK